MRRADPVHLAEQGEQVARDLFDRFDRFTIDFSLQYLKLELLYFKVFDMSV